MSLLSSIPFLPWLGVVSRFSFRTDKISSSLYHWLPNKLFVTLSLTSLGLVTVGRYQTSRPVWQIFKILTVRKPDVFLPGRRTFNTFKSRRKKKKKEKFSITILNIFFFIFFFKIYFVYLQMHPNLDFFDTKFVSMDLSYENW